MNTAQLKRFAQAARRKLMEQVGAKLDFVLSSDSPELREKYRQTEELRKELQHTGKAEVIEKVSYTWFNRLVALRYMDVNDYQPSGIRVITPTNSYTQPQAVTEAKQGNIPEEWRLDREKVFDLLDGRIPASNPQNEAFRMMLVAACNHLNSVFPFLFEKIDDYSELLLPDDLTSPFSIVHDVVEGMAMEDCQAIEVIGWLYQFYISERKDEVFASKSKVSKEDIPAATQLFTPRWIVEYMVQNTVGRLWLLNRPNSRLKEHMTYYIDPVEPVTDYLKIGAPTEITLLDQACGSGHILVYSFDLLSKIYEEEGYSPSEIPSLIIENNLKGFEIDTRAAQLAGFALMMKAREYNRRAFRKNLKPDITCFSDFELAKDETGRLLRLAGITPTTGLLSDLDLMRNATNLGSLINPGTSTATLEESYRKTNIAYQVAGIFEKEAYQQITEALGQLLKLSQKVTCVVANPPYMGSGKMNDELSEWLQKTYPRSKADLFSCFIERSICFLPKCGMIGMITMESWMFLSSFEDFRKNLLKIVKIENLIHMPYLGKGGTSLGINFGTTSFVFMLSSPTNDTKGFYQYIRYFETDDEGKPNKFPTQNDRLRISKQSNFKRIPGSPIGYWLKDDTLDIFTNSEDFGDFADPRLGMSTNDNNRFLRYWTEVGISKTFFNAEGISNAKLRNEKWFPYNKGGNFRRWYGNNEFVLNWEKDGEEVKGYAAFLYTSYTRTVKNIPYFFKEALTWNLVSSSYFAVRKLDEGFIIGDAGPTCYPKKNDQPFTLSLLNSKIATYILKILNPTFNFSPGVLRNFPLVTRTEFKIRNIIDQKSNENLTISRNDWNSKETSWSFKKSELLLNRNETLHKTLNSLKINWKDEFNKLHSNEEELNNYFIKIYDLSEELSPDVPLEEITILQQELYRDALAQLNQKLKRDPITHKVLNYDEIELPFDTQEVMAQFVSYSVGCMFGRYSLDKPGLILANQGETLEDYLRIVDDGSLTSDEGSRPGRFLPDEDNVIPVLDDDWFEDDITGRFKKFLKASFGEEHFKENLDFVEECLGKDIRTWFVRDFYPDHVRRYKKRPIYWMFSSPRGNFNALIYMHRYTPDTVSHILNGYLRQLQEKLRMRKQHLQHVQVSGTNTERTQALRESERIEQVLMELHGYERDILYPLAAERISIDLDDGVLVNYNRFGKAVKEITGLNDAATKKKVKAFDWVDTSNIK